MVTPGQNVSYTVTVTADKAYTAYSIADVMTGRNANFTWVAGTMSLNGAAATTVNPTFGDTLNFAGTGALAKGDVVVIKYTLQAKATAAAGKYSNTATATLDGRDIPTKPVDVTIPITKAADKTALL